MVEETKSYIENLTFQQQKEKSIDLLLKMRTISAYLDLLNICKQKIEDISCVGVNEYEFFELKGRGLAFQEIADYCKSKIETFKDL